MKINGYEMDWMVFVPGDDGKIIDEFDASDDCCSLLITGEKKEENGERVTWAGYWDKDTNSIEIYWDGTTAQQDEANVMCFLVEDLLESTEDAVPFDADDTDEVRAFLHALDDRISSDEEMNHITTHHVYVIDEEKGCDVFTDITMDKEEAMSRLYTTSDKGIGDITVTEVIAAKINDPSIVDKLGYDSEEEMIAACFNGYRDFMTNEANARFASHILSSGLFFYVDYNELSDYCISSAYTTREDRALIKKAEDTLELARFQVENESISELCFDAYTIDIRSDDDLKRMLSYFPAIEDALREADYDDTADDLEHLDLQIVRAFELN